MNVKTIPIHDTSEIFWAAALWWLEKHEISAAIPICEDPEPDSKSFADKDPGFRIELPGLSHHEQLGRLIALAPLSVTWYNDEPSRAVRVLDELDAFCTRCGGHFLRTGGEWDGKANKCRICSKQPSAERQVA
jgi:hypothetical protein